METQNSNQSHIQNQIPNQVQNQTDNGQNIDKKGASAFKNFFLITLIYAIFYTFCLYKNYSGITYPLFACGTLCFFNILFKKTESGSIKENKLISAAIVFTSLITPTTDSVLFIHFNKYFIILLFVILILKTVFKTKFQKWTIEQFFTCILNSFYDLFANLLTPFKDYSAFKKEKALNLVGDDRLSKEKALKKQMQLSVLKGLLIAVPLI